MDVRNLSEIEVVKRIQNFGAVPDFENRDFDIYEQLLVCESIAETENTGNAFVSGNANDTYKRSVKFEVTENKLLLIKRLKACTYKTPPLLIAELLDQIFGDPNTKENHWLYIAQAYPPRRIYLTINQMIKRQKGGWTTIKNPSAYFTHLIKFRKKRKLTSTNGGF